MMKGELVGYWIGYDPKKDYTCSNCNEKWPKRFKRCPSCNILMRNGIITFMEEYDGREVNKETTFELPLL